MTAGIAYANERLLTEHCQLIRLVDNIRMKPRLWYSVNIDWLLEHNMEEKTCLRYIIVKYMLK